MDRYCEYAQNQYLRVFLFIGHAYGLGKLNLQETQNGKLLSKNYVKLHTI